MSQMARQAQPLPRLDNKRRVWAKKTELINALTTVKTDRLI